MAVQSGFWDEQHLFLSSTFGDMQAERDVSVSYGKLGDLERAEGNAAAARDYYQKGLQIREELLELLPTYSESHRDLAVSHFKLFQFHSELGEQEQAVTALQNCHAVLSGMRRRGMFMDAPIANLLEQLDNQFGQQESEEV